MSIRIDNVTRTCAIELNGQTHHSAIMDARITTDPATRMSVLNIDGASAHVTEEQVVSLINGGAKDDRENLIVDD
ncbi:DUF3203 family protein [Stutzerimonas urumqiensis]|uniref:DUF3203 family protein n=1 Tax=Stutzerimonas urumqiensis TaxID=638269 RepID=UPI000EAEF2C5|nr:DUF3203 family protein [Stutzerimonas urumqiensis]